MTKKPEPDHIGNFVETFQLIYAVSFTVCLTNSVDAYKVCGMGSLLPAVALLLVAFRLIFATKALNHFLSNGLVDSAVAPCSVTFFHTPVLILQSVLIYAASTQLVKDPNTAAQLTSWALVCNGFWLFSLKRFADCNFWATNNIVMSSVALIGSRLFHSDQIAFGMLVANSLIDLVFTSEWYLGLPLVPPGDRVKRIASYFAILIRARN